MPHCLICYTAPTKQSPLQKLPSCECNFCNECLTNWAGEQIVKMENVSKDLIRCPESTCHKQYILSDFTNVLSSSDIVVINDALAKKYCQMAPDIRSCPNSKCNNYGFLNPKACDAPLKCSICNTEWNDYAQFSNWKKTQIYLQNIIVKKNEIFSSFFEELFTNMCPKCDVHIQKNGGCIHMTCSKCHFEFCWFCKQKWKAHSPILCGESFASMVILVLFVWSMFCQKIGILSWFFYFSWMVIKYLFKNFIFNNLFCFFICYFFSNISYYKNQRKIYYFRPAISTYFPLIAAGLAALLMLFWMIYQQTIYSCITFLLMEVAIGGTVASTYFFLAYIWDKWLSLVF